LLWKVSKLSTGNNSVPWNRRSSRGGQPLNCGHFIALVARLLVIYIIKGNVPGSKTISSSNFFLGGNFLERIF
jgi:hypothetical protein